MRVYTSTPDRLVVVELAQGLDSSGLQVSTTVAYTFYGDSTGYYSICDNRCREVPHVVNALWLP